MATSLRVTISFNTTLDVPFLNLTVWLSGMSKIESGIIPLPWPVVIPANEGKSRLYCASGSWGLPSSPIASCSMNRETSTPSMLSTADGGLLPCPRRSESKKISGIWSPSEEIDLTVAIPVRPRRNAMFSAAL